MGRALPETSAIRLAAHEPVLHSLLHLSRAWSPSGFGCGQREKQDLLLGLTTPREIGYRRR